MKLITHTWLESIELRCLILTGDPIDSRHTAWGLAMRKVKTKSGEWDES